MRVFRDAGQPATRRKCFDFMCELEDYYSISLKFWLSWSPDPGGEPALILHLSGSGQVFDDLLPAKGRTMSRVVDAQEGSIYPAMWSTLIQLDYNLKTIYVTLDPSVPMRRN